VPTVTVDVSSDFAPLAPRFSPANPSVSFFFFSLHRSSPPRLRTAAAHISSSSPLDYSTPAGRSVVKTHLQERIDNPDFTSYYRHSEFHPTTRPCILPPLLQHQFLTPAFPTPPTQNEQTFNDIYAKDFDPATAKVSLGKRPSTNIDFTCCNLDFGVPHKISVPRFASPTKCNKLSRANSFQAVECPRSERCRHKGRD
jgi:hypothetical protein